MAQAALARTKINTEVTQGATEAKLAEKLAKVKERLQADAANMERRGADLIAHYPNPGRLPVKDR